MHLLHNLTKAREFRAKSSYFSIQIFLVTRSPGHRRNIDSEGKVLYQTKKKYFTSEVLYTITFIRTKGGYPDNIFQVKGE